MKIVKKIFQLIREIKLHGFLGNIYNYISPEKYMKSYTKALKKRGINIVGNPKFISNSVWFDGNDYSKITIGDNVTISKEVMLLTHDYSITTAFATIGKKIERGGGEIYFSKAITIGNNCFIGARVTLLPGTTIGDNCIIGACSVVKGTIDSNSIIVGNPARKIGETTAFARNHLDKKDYYTEE